LGDVEGRRPEGEGRFRIPFLSEGENGKIANIDEVALFFL
jgi:hypothetical protein